MPLVNIFFGEIDLGRRGSGLYGMLFYIIIAVFIAGLMVGRTPEYLGKKIEAREIKYAAVGALLVPTVALVTTAISVVTHAGLLSIYNTGAHGFSEALYAYTSQANNNGSAFAGYGGKTFSEQLGSVSMLLGRFAPLAGRTRNRRLAGSQGDRAGVRRDVQDRRPGRFTVLLVGVIIFMTART